MRFDDLRGSRDAGFLTTIKTREELSAELPVSGMLCPASHSTAQKMEAAMNRLVDYLWRASMLKNASKMGPFFDKCDLLPNCRIQLLTNYETVNSGKRCNGRPSDLFFNFFEACSDFSHKYLRIHFRREWATFHVFQLDLNRSNIPSLAIQNVNH